MRVEKVQFWCPKCYQFVDVKYEPGNFKDRQIVVCSVCGYTLAEIRPVVKQNSILLMGCKSRDYLFINYSVLGKLLREEVKIPFHKVHLIVRRVLDSVIGVEEEISDRITSFELYIDKDVVS